LIDISFIINCIYLDELAAKVAAHASDCYKEAYTSAKTENAKKIIPEVSESTLFLGKYISDLFLEFRPYNVC